MMRKNVLTILAFIAVWGVTIAQESDEMMDQTSYNDYNKWSIDASAGVTKPARPMSSGSFTNTPSFYTVDLAGRYMFNDKAGLRLGLGMNSFEGDDEDGSNPFKTRLYRASLEGVINAGNILGFREWTNTLNFLVHGGGGYSKLVPSEPNDVDFSDGDQMLHLVVGVTPQLKLSDRIALFGDVSLYGNIRQDLTFNGVGRGTKRGVDGYYVNASAGISVYLGKNEEHADWYSRANTMANDLDSIQSRVAKIEGDLEDTDRDGVPNYLDREPNTVSGVTVDTKGVAVDKNENGIPDELESSLDARYAKKGEVGNGSGSDIIEKLINDGYVNVYFKFNSTEPDAYSYEAINYLIKYMNENSGANAELIGYADEIGNPDYNQTLSEKRAQKVKDILVASGVSEGRLEVSGNGEDTSVDKGSAPARQLVRRVTFKLK